MDNTPTGLDNASNTEGVL